jgi:endonuclease/exonuclease/phosphatase family metal-dependent hydrolase
MSSQVLGGRAARRRALLATVLLTLAATLSLGLLTDGADAAKKSKNVKVKVMSRNLYLGGNLRPLIDASNINQAIDLAGEVANQVDATNFPLRAKALAAEILDKKPDLVGLQEVALWRTAPTNFGITTQGPTATNVEYDFLELLLSELNKSGNNYEVVVTHQELDGELVVNDDTSDGQSGVAGADHNERLTLRDVILRRTDSKVKTSNPSAGTFNLVLRVNPAGALVVDVNRGWNAVVAHAKGMKSFRFINTHLEAYDDTGSNTANDGNTYGRGQIRLAQAQQLVGPGGAATGKRVILIGDINSDDDTVQPNGDQDAYLALLAAGFSPRTKTTPPLSCCLEDNLLVAGSVADFDHQVDHILVNTKKIKLVSSTFTGLAPVSGLWPADHAGVFSVLRVPGKK